MLPSTLVFSASKLSPLVLFVFLGGAIPNCSLHAADASRPNVLLIMADDLRPQLGCYGDPVVKSPHIDRLAGRSLRFERAYVQCAICSPSRNSMLSGLRPNTTGLRGFGVRVREQIPKVVTLPQHFKQNGYYSRAFGKIFHIYAESMLGSEDDPESWSEPLQLPNVPVWGPEQTALRERLIEEARAAGKKFNHPHDWPRARTWDDSDIPDDQMQDGETANMAIEFLKSRVGQSQPFFLAVGFLRPHLPFNAPRRYWELYEPHKLPLPTFRQLPRDAPQWTVNRGIVKNYYEMPASAEVDDSFLQQYLQAYLACISYVDACTGRVLDALQASGHANDTIVVFLGDHGYQMGEYDSWGHKHSNFEISTRAPLLISSPGAKSSGQATSALVEFLDIYPTLCDLAGLTTPEQVEGKSFKGLLDGTQNSHHAAAYSEMQRGGRLGRSMRTEHVRFTQWRDAQGDVVAEELYDHAGQEHQAHSDASYNGQLETTNAIQQLQYADLLPELRQRLVSALPHETQGRR